MSTIDEIMAEVVESQDSALSWYLHTIQESELDAQTRKVRNLITAALAEARREGAEAMRESAVKRVIADGWMDEPDAAETIGALPLPTGKRQAVRLTDAEVKQIGNATLYAGGIYDRVRAIEAAELAANGLGDAK